jgi:HEAT repeat protein
MKILPFFSSQKTMILEVRTEVALVIGSIPLERAAKALSKMLEDPEEEVRLAARKSLDSRRK